MNKTSESGPENLYKQEMLNGFEIIVVEEPKVALQQVVVNQIVDKSRQDELQETVPRDSTERFVDFDSYRNWAAGGKIIFALLGRDEDLGGLIWFSKKLNDLASDADFTFAIRLYDGYRQRGLAKPFMSLAHFVLPRVTQSSGNTWLETNSDNTPAQKLYLDFGYKFVGISSAGREVMAYTNTDE
jgi:hypothetical protein